MINLALFTMALFLSFPATAKSRSVIFDHDGGVDDYAALAMILLTKDLDVKGISVVPADSFKEPAVRATVGLLKFLNRSMIPIAASDDAGPNPFPDKWRHDVDRLLLIPELKAEMPPAVPQAADKLIEWISREKKIDLVVTGPLTNIAAALRKDPKIKDRISRIYLMGGAYKVTGNVNQPNHDHSAEWNIYNNPGAAREVFSSGIPITMVGLDATNKTPVTKKFMHALKAQNSKPVSRVFYSVWKVIAEQIEHPEYDHTYYFWDTLAAGAFLQNDLVKTQSHPVAVVTSGVNQGQTKEEKGARSIDVAVDANPAKLEKLILDLFNR